MASRGTLISRWQAGHIDEFIEEILRHMKDGRRGYIVEYIKRAFEKLCYIARVGSGSLELQGLVCTGWPLFVCD
jgi:hypothetical protein